MTDEEQFLILQDEIERWLRSQGVDVDLDAMSQEELAAFWANPPVSMDDLEKFIEAVMTMETINRPETNWIWDRSFDEVMFGSEEADWGGLALDAAMVLPFFRWGRMGGAALGRLFPAGTKLPGWLGKALGLTDEAGTVLKGGPPGAGWVSGAPPITRVGAGGMVAAGGVAAGAAAANIAGAGPPFSFSNLQGETEIGGIKIPSPFGPGGPEIYEPEGMGEGFLDPEPDRATDPEGWAAWDEDRRKTQPAIVGDIFGEGEGQVGVMKQLFFEGLSEQAAFDKMTNYMANSGVHVLVGSGVSLAEAIKQQERTQQGPLGDIEFYDLAGSIQSPGSQKVREYLLANWQNISQISEHPALTARGPGQYPQAMLEQFGPIGPGEENHEAVLNNIVDDFLSQMVKVSDTLLLAPEKPSGAGMAIGFMTSYDGTQMGDVVSFNDFFSGGKIGPLNLVPQLERARPEQIAFWQQQLYAWGFMERPPSAWGVITVDPDGSRPTVEAAHNWQVSVVNEGVQLVREANRRGPTQRGRDPATWGELITEDGTPRIDRVMDRAIASQMAGAETIGTRDRVLRARVVGEAQNRVAQYLEDTGRILPEGSKFKLEDGLKKTLANLSPGQQEAAFGQGGSQYERGLAEELLKEYYGADDWKTHLTFGNKNRDSSFFDYAMRVGAVSERERDLLQAGGIFRDRYREHWTGREEQLTEAEADVAVAGLLKFIGETTTSSLVDASVDDLVKGMMVYANTIGANQGIHDPKTEEDYMRMAQRALGQMQAFQRDDQIVGDVAGQGVDELGLRGGVSGFQFKNLVDSLNRVGSSSGRLRAPNV